MTERREDRSSSAYYKECAERLCEFIPYFESVVGKEVSWLPPKQVKPGEWTMGWPLYDDEVELFLEVLYDIDFIDFNYRESLDKRLPDRDFRKAISSADAEMIRTILTLFARGEHFCPGYWGEILPDGTVLRALYRLKELLLDEKSLP